MPKTTTKTQATERGPGPFGERLAKARAEAGYQLDEAAVFVKDVLRPDRSVDPGRRGPSRETIRRMEVGAITEDEADPVIVHALATIYGVELNHISQLAALRIDTIRSLLDTGRPPIPRRKTRTGTTGQRTTGQRDSEATRRS